MLTRSAPVARRAERDPWAGDSTQARVIDDESMRSDIGAMHELSAPSLETTRDGGTIEHVEQGSASVHTADFDAELLAHLPPAYGYALRLARHRADAEDLVQEAALLACRARHTFEPGTNFKAWFFRILVRCFYARHRMAKRRPQTVDLDDTPDVFLYGNFIESGLPSYGDDPAREMLDRLGTEGVAEAIRALPTEYGIVCTLCFMQDFSYHEIAEVLDIPVGTVRSRLHRGRKMLQKTLWHAAQEAGVIDALTHSEKQRT
ncbi:MAG: sigma-70 family RNA polymerase sigma factor [Gemmatimonadaceae bacterium]